MGAQHVSPYRQLLAERQRLFYSSIESGHYEPYVYPWDTSPIFLMIAGVLFIPRLPHRLQKPASYAVYACIFSETVRVMASKRMLTFAGGYGIGLSLVWVAIMSFTLFICNDVGTDFQRIEARLVPDASEHHEGNGHANGSARASSSQMTDAPDLKSRRVPSVYVSRNVNQMDFPGSEKPATKPYKLVWQGYPLDSSWYHRLEWAVDLATSFRGVGWAHRIPSAGPIDVHLPKNPTDKTAPTENGVRPTAVPKRTLRALELQAVQDFVIGYLLLDLLKTTMITDPYFLGQSSLESPTPWPWLAAANESIPVATRVVRLAIALVGVVTALTFIFSLNALFFVAILPRLADITRVTKAPLQEPWLYPPQWAPLKTSVLESGLAGLWGRYWHQMFRYGISEPSRVLIKALKLDPKGFAARVIQLLIAFGLSGSIHAGGSYSTFSVTGSNPLSGPMLFFLLQGLGMLLQSWTIEILHARIPQARSLPRAVGEATNLIYVVVFLYVTGPLLSDDFARCGLWTFEPVPISPLRALGFGPGGKDEGWFTWYQDGARWVGWWHNERWWRRGIALW